MCVFSEVARWVRLTWHTQTDIWLMNQPNTSPGKLQDLDARLAECKAQARRSAAGGRYHAGLVARHVAWQTRQARLVRSSTRQPSGAVATAVRAQLAFFLNKFACLYAPPGDLETLLGLSHVVFFCNMCAGGGA